MKLIVTMFAVVLTLACLLLLGAKAYQSVQFDRNCGGHLKRAADANTIELARQELEIAVSYLEREKMTNGYTSVIYNTPDEDVGFWYGNLRASLYELSQVKSDSSSLEKSNMLIKLRETLLDGGQQGESITAPQGISIFPNNAAFFWSTLFSAILAVVFWAVLFIADPY